MLWRDEMDMSQRDERAFAVIFGHSKRVSDGDGLDACAEALARDEDADLNADEFTLRGRLRNRHGLRPPFHGWGELLREAWHLRHKDIVT
jgi:hypothetical protein